MSTVHVCETSYGRVSLEPVWLGSVSARIEVRIDPPLDDNEMHDQFGIPRNLGDSCVSFLQDVTLEMSLGLWGLRTEKHGNGLSFGWRLGAFTLTLIKPRAKVLPEAASMDRWVSESLPVILRAIARQRKESDESKQQIQVKDREEKIKNAVQAGLDRKMGRLYLAKIESDGLVAQIEALLVQLHRIETRGVRLDASDLQGLEPYLQKTDVLVDDIVRRIEARLDGGVDLPRVRFQISTRSDTLVSCTPIDKPNRIVP